MTSFYSREELALLGLKSYGDDVLISRRAQLYCPENISIGCNVRIDDFCILSAGTLISIGNYVHIGCYSSLIGKGNIIISDFCSISGRVSLYSSSDDYSGEYMTNPMVPQAFTHVTDAPITMRKHVIVGCGTVILPGVTLEEGCAIGAMSLVQTDCASNMIYAGNPLRKLIPRSDRYKDFELKITEK